jgi:hypothetical protein
LEKMAIYVYALLDQLPLIAHLKVKAALLTKSAPDGIDKACMRPLRPRVSGIGKP